MKLPALALKVIISLTWAWGLVNLATQAQDLDDYLRQNLQTNGTDPGLIQSFDRGVYYGGNYNLRSQLLTLQLLSFDAPYINAGCGGLDLYAGSFSYINKEQFNQLLKAVAANALGYSFNLALTHVCPTCSQVVESLQRKIQQLNQHLGNSCALAQGIVNDTVAAFTKSKNNKISLMAHLKGLGDTFSSFSSNAPEHKAQLLQNPQVKESLYGNLVYKALKRAYGKTYSKDYLEQIMSLTGTIVSQAQGKKPDSLVTYRGELISLKVLLQGGAYSRYSCSNQDCSQLTITTNQRESYASRIRRLYLGQGGAGGLIMSYAQNQGSLTAQQKRELANLGEGINSQVRSLAILSPEAAANYVKYALEYLALKAAQHEIEYAFRLVNNALVTVNNDTSIEKLKALLNTNQQKYLQNLSIESQKHNPLSIVSYYNQLYQALTQGGVKGK